MGGITLEIDPKGIIILTMVALVMALHLLQTFISFGVYAKLKALCRNLGQITSLPSKLRAWWRRKAAHKNTEVAEKILEWKVSQFCWMLQYMSFIFLVAGGYMTYDMLCMDGEGCTLGEMVLFLIGYVLTVVPLAFPRVIGKRTVDLWYSAYILTIALYASPVGSGRWDDLPRSLHSGVRVFMVLVAVSRMSVARAFASCVLVGTGLLPIWLSESGGGTAMREDMGFFAAVVAVVAFLERQSTLSITNELSNTTMKEQQNAFKGLLRNFCDVVLDLDKDLRIIGPAQDLAVFLLHGTKVSLERRHIGDFLTKESQQFVERLDPSHSQRSMAEAVHVKMRGANTSTLEAELFCFGYQKHSKDMRYMIGIREYSDGMYGVPKQLPEHGTGKVKKHKSSGANDVPDEQEVTVTVNTVDQELPILTSSATFQLLVGSMPTGSRLAKVMCNGFEFSQWVQRRMNKLMSKKERQNGTEDSSSDLEKSEEGKMGNAESEEEASDNKSDEPSEFEVKFKAHAGVQTFAKCSLQFVKYERPEDDDDDEDEDEDTPLVAKLIFTGVERKRHEKSRSIRSGSSGSRSSSSSIPSFAGAFAKSNGRERRLANAVATVGVPLRGTRCRPNEADTGSLSDTSSVRSSAQSGIASPVIGKQTPVAL